MGAAEQEEGEGEGETRKALEGRGRERAGQEAGGAEAWARHHCFLPGVARLDFSREP